MCNADDLPITPHAGHGVHTCNGWIGSGMHFGFSNATSTLHMAYAVHAAAYTFASVSPRPPSQYGLLNVDFSIMEVVQLFTLKL